ncbi:MAG TPA: dehydratase [Nevskiaceae bacterium]
MRYWEDLEIGEVASYGAMPVQASEIAEFAREYDSPAWEGMHRAASTAAPVASRWQVCGFCMRLLVEHALDHSTSMGSPGVQHLRWLRPVRAGDVLSLRQTMLRKAPHPHRPQVGFIDFRFELCNQRGEVVMWMESSGMLRRRPHPEGA